MEGYSIRQIAKLSGKTESLIRNDIHIRLDTNTIHCIDAIFPDIRYVMIDGYALPRADGQEQSDILLVYYEYIQKKVVWFSIRDGEKKTYIIEDLKFLKERMGYTNITTFLSDGSHQIAGAIKRVYPESLHQRCLVHIQRQVRNYISNNPKTHAGKQLKHIMNYTILSDAFLFPLLFQIWKRSYL